MRQNRAASFGLARRGIVLLLLASCAGCGDWVTNPSAISDDQRAESIAKLRAVMDSQERWVKVHAAESLLELGYPRGVAEAFKNELASHGDEPEYRIGVWRVLAKAPKNSGDDSNWSDRIKAAFFDENGPDRVHAVESMAKLGIALTPDELQSVEESTASADPRMAAFSRWALAVADTENRPSHLDELVKLLDSAATESRSIAAYALRQLGPLDPTRWNRIVERAQAETDPFVKQRLYGAALVAAPIGVDEKERDAVRAQAIQAETHGDARSDIEIARILADAGRVADLPALLAYMRATTSPGQDTTQEAAAADLSAMAANAILRVERRNNRHAIHWIDWLVIVGYGFAMIWIGLYYSRRVKNREDYLLGGRSMRPWMVGLSLFATIISTISYLAYPGELIKYGPLAFASILALPFVFVAVGWWLIPSLMRLTGVSGYELLEERLGVGIRLLGASVFLVLRFVWMATIIYATTTIALLPALGVDPARAKMYAPLVCAVLGCVTLGYTSMGGLRAVVFTDVIQTFILFAGAIIAVILVTAHFGGFGWIPKSWPSHWQEPSYGLGFRERITVGNAMIFMLAWYVCTCGSDQMAIQRFKATRDAVAARRSFGVTLIAQSLVKVVLGFVGLAVMAYFIDQPHKLPDQTSVFTNSDQMFPRFVVIAIPVGLTGLVISGIMAAAMSSLSSGISAATSVISDDFIKRFRGLPAGEHAKLTEERWISAAIGITVVALSLLVGYVPGNLFEITNRLVNAFVAPLFVLFFMAIFVPWATPAGAVVGFVASAVVAIAIALFQVWDISMMWIIPSSMLAGGAAGCIASLFAPATASEPGVSP